MTNEENKTVELEPEVINNMPVRVRKSNAGVFWGLLLMTWGVALIIDNYLQINIFRNFWPIVAVVFGGYLIFSSFKR